MTCDRTKQMKREFGAHCMSTRLNELDAFKLALLEPSVLTVIFPAWKERKYSSQDITNSMKVIRANTQLAYTHYLESIDKLSAMATDDQEDGAGLEPCSMDEVGLDPSATNHDAPSVMSMDPPEAEEDERKQDDDASDVDMLSRLSVSSRSTTASIREGVTDLDLKRGGDAMSTTSAVTNASTTYGIRKQFTKFSLQLPAQGDGLASARGKRKADNESYQESPRKTSRPPSPASASTPRAAHARSKPPLPKRNSSNSREAKSRTNLNLASSFKSAETSGRSSFKFDITNMLETINWHDANANPTLIQTLVNSLQTDVRLLSKLPLMQWDDAHGLYLSLRGTTGEEDVNLDIALTRGLNDIVSNMGNHLYISLAKKAIGEDRKSNQRLEEGAIACENQVTVIQGVYGLKKAEAEQELEAAKSKLADIRKEEETVVGPRKAMLKKFAETAVERMDVINLMSDIIDCPPDQRHKKNTKWVALTKQLLTSSLADKLSKDARKAIEGEKEIPEMVGFQGSSDMSTLYCGTVGAEGRDTSPRVETTDAMAPPSHSGMPSATGVTPHTQHSQSSDPKVEDPTDVLSTGQDISE